MCLVKNINSCLLGNFANSFVVCLFFFKINFSVIILGIPSECQTVWIQIRSNIFRNTISVSNSLDPDQARHFREYDQECQTVWIQIRPDIFVNTIRVSNSLDPDQARHFVRPDLDPNCLQKLSADVTSRQRGDQTLTVRNVFVFSKPRTLETFMSISSAVFPPKCHA